MKLCLLLSVCLGIQVLVPVFAQTPAGTAAPPPGHAQAGTGHACSVDHSVATDGDKALASRDYKAAEAAYRTALTQNTADKAGVELGLIRSLIGQDRMEEAQAEARTLAQDTAAAPLAEVAQADVAYRMADVDGAVAHAKKALTLDPCEARAAATLGNVLDLNGYYATEARLLQRAHSIRPTDELIRRDWIQSLPRKQRQAELSRYLEGEHHLSADDSRGYTNTLEHLKARRPGECRVTSKQDSTRIPLQLIYGDHQYPVAFGMDVAFGNTRRRMQIDTGASGILLTESAARALKLQPEYKIKTGGVGDEGERDSYLAHVASIRIGDVEVSDCMVEVVSKSKLDVDGLIGMDVFERWIVTLDYANAQVLLGPIPPRPVPQLAQTQAQAQNQTPTLDDTGDTAVPQDRYIAPEMKDWTPVLRLGHSILLPSEFTPQSPIHFLIMDTGASMTTLSSTMARERGKLHGSEMEFIGLSGKVKKVFETDRTPLIAANMRLPDSIYYAYDLSGLSHDEGFEISGLLGLPTLQRLTIKIDYRDNLLKILYDPKHDVMRF